MAKTLLSVFLFFVLCSLAGVPVFGQTTEVRYQGSLQNGGTAATGNFDFEFLLFDGGGAQIGPLLTRGGVTVTNGIFFVDLDFGSSFTGASRLLEIRVRPNGGGAFTTLSPRQPVKSAPYSIKSLTADNAATAANSTQLGGIAANQYVQTVDPRLTDARNPLAGSASYIQNQGAAAQAASNFNITGTGKANAFDAAGEFRINGIPALRSSQGNELVSVGPNSGISANGTFNTFAGSFTGSANRFGGANTFIGSRSGIDNRDGGNNTFVGFNAGVTNAGLQDVSNNTLIGAESKLDLSTVNGSNATAIGYRSMAQLSNTLILGAVQGVNGGTGVNVGIGTTGPQSRLHIRAGVGNLLLGDSGCGSNFNGIGFGSQLTCNNYSMLGDGLSTWINRATGGTLYFREANNDQVFIRPGGFLGINFLAGGGTATLCRNGNNEVSFCSSSRRYKTDIENYSGGLDLLQKFRPVEFTWKAGGKRDVGFIAEEVAEIEPLLTFKNLMGEIEGVQYAHITTILVNSIKEQQTQIESQKALIDAHQNSIRELREQVDALKKLMCDGNPSASVCR